MCFKCVLFVSSLEDSPAMAAVSGLVGLERQIERIGSSKQQEALENALDVYITKLTVIVRDCNKKK